MAEQRTEQYGNITISDDVIAACISEAVAATEGVYSLSGGFSDTLSRNLLGKDSKYKGMKISEAEEGLTIDVQIIACYGVKIPEIAWDLQKNIRTEVEEVTEAAVESVNVHVQGVHFASREEQTR